MRQRRLGDFKQRRLRAQRHTGAALQRQQRLDHQQPQAVLLLRHRGEQHLGALRHGLRGQRGDGMAQHAGDDLGVQMFFKDFKTPLRPGFAHRRRQRRHQIGHEGGQPHAQLGMAEAVPQGARVVRANGVKQRLNQGISACIVHDCLGQNDSRYRGVLRQQVLQSSLTQADHLARAQAGIEQPANQLELLHLLQAVQPVARGITRRRGKPIAPLPHAQRVLAQAGLAFDSGNRQPGIAGRGRCRDGRRGQ